MEVQGGAPACVGAAENLRPHCRQPGACSAKTVGKHCPTCTALNPEVVARKVAATRKKAAARRVIYFAQRKTCTGCGTVFGPRKKVDVKAWAARQYCSISCTARSIMLRDDVRQRHLEATRERFKDPEYRARHAAAARINGKIAVSFSNRQKAGRTRTRLAIGWIPQDLMKPYLRLREQHGAREAKRMIRERMAEQSLARLDHDLAAAHLRRLAPITRCDEQGKPALAGSHWRYGSRVLERIEVIRLAIHKGATPERLSA